MDCRYAILIENAEGNETYNQSVHNTFVSLRMSKGHYRVTVSAVNCAGKSRPSLPISIHVIEASLPQLDVAVDNGSITVAWNGSNQCFGLKIGKTMNRSCSNEGAISTPLIPGTFYDVKVITEPNSSFITTSPITKEYYCVAYSVAPPPRILNIDIEDDKVYLNVTLRSHCDPGELLHHCLCPRPTGISIQLDNGDTILQKNINNVTTILLEVNSSGYNSSVIIGRVLTVNECGLGQGALFAVARQRPIVDSTSGGGTLESTKFILLVSLLLLLIIVLL